VLRGECGELHGFPLFNTALYFARFRIFPRRGAAAAGRANLAGHSCGCARVAPQSAAMKALAALFILIAAALPAAAGERVIIYAMLTEGQVVDLSNGEKWRMDKGDCFPVIAYKESHTKIVLQLAGAQFMMAAAKTRVVPEKEMPAAVEKYRANVNTYINGYAARWRAQAEGGRKPE
jgi:hypothetical protein